MLRSLHPRLEQGFLQDKNRLILKQKITLLSFVNAGCETCTLLWGMMAAGGVAPGMDGAVGNGRGAGIVCAGV